MGIGITFDGGLTWEQALMQLPLSPPFAAFDPYAWPDGVTGNIWLLASAYNEYPFNSRQWLFALQRSPGMHASQLPVATQLTFPVLGQFAEDHVGRMTAGPAPLGGSGRNLYIMFTRALDPYFPSCPNPGVCFRGHIALLRSIDDGTSWTSHLVKPAVQPCHPQNTDTCEYEKLGLDMLVLDRPPHQGALLILGADDAQDFGSYPAFGLYVIWSHDGGITWPAVPNIISLVPIDLYPHEEMIPGVMRQEFYGDMALDSTTGDVYVVACRRKAAGSQNLDLFLFRGQQTGTGGTSPPISFGPPIDLHLDTGPTWGDGPDQFMPEIVIDAMGGVNILYYSTQNDPLQRPDNSTGTGTLMDVYYTRVTEAGTPNQTISTHRLTNSFCTLCEHCASNPCPYENQFLPEFMGDYHGIDARGCLVLATYATTEFGTSTSTKKRHYYTRLINVCPADANESMVVEITDPGAFMTLYSQQDEAADLTMDGTVDSSDLAEFTAQYLLANP